MKEPRMTRPWGWFLAAVMVVGVMLSLNEVATAMQPRPARAQRAEAVVACATAWAETMVGAPSSRQSRSTFAGHVEPPDPPMSARRRLVPS